MPAQPLIRVKRVYEPVGVDDGTRILVDRLWPRGVAREKSALYAWLKDAAPSDGLRKWFGHEPSRWTAFQRQYFIELTERPQEVEFILDAARKGPVTLLFSAKDQEHNNAVALKKFLEQGPLARKFHPSADGAMRRRHPAGARA